MLPSQDPSPRLPSSRNEKLLLAIAAVVLGGLLTLELADGFRTAKLSVLFVTLWWGPLLILHELGHALAARWVGWQVSEIVIGFGRELTRFRVRGTLVRVCAVPLEGYVVPSPRNLSQARGKSAFIFFAGPGAELLLVFGLYAAMGTSLAQKSSEVGVIFAQSAAVAALLGAGFNLLPYVSRGSASDGLGILLSFFQDEESFRARFAAPIIATSRRLLYYEQPNQALAAVDRALLDHPSDPQLSSLRGVCLAACGNASAGLEQLESLKHPDEYPPFVRRELLLNAAWFTLFKQDRTLLHEAQAACQRALEFDPESVRANLLLGRVLLERQRDDDAYHALMNGYKAAQDADDESQLLAYLAIACQRARRTDYASRFAHAISTRHVGPELYRQLQEELHSTK